MEEKTLQIPSISCGHCIMTIKQEVGGLNGVRSVQGDEKNKEVIVKWENPATWEKIAHTLKEIGHPAG